MKNDSNKYYAALREMSNMQKPKPVIVTDKQGKVAGTTAKKLELITEYFKKALAPKEMEEKYKSYKPAQMRRKFTKEEIKKIAKRLKNGKSAGIDKLNAEFIKYAPDAIYEHIANIFNRVAETGDHMEHLITGLLTPLPKPGKKKGPPANLRPIILLSILRKLLTICMLNRIWDRLETQIPKEQAAYQGGRSTTEQVLALKLLTEKAILDSDYNIYITLLDMSKAFDTVNRELLFQNLENILQEDELHILSKITNNPEIKIKLENKIGKKFTTYHGIMQGDCLSAVLFIYYLACALKEEQETTENKDHNYCKKEEKEMQINPKYADDITYITTSKATHQNTEKITSERLSKYNLMVNDTKTEIYQVPEEKKERPPPEPVLSEDDGRRNLWSELDWVLPEPIPPEPPPRWKECKLLGSKLGTENDIANRKGLTIGAMAKFRRIFKTKFISTAIKIRVFLCFICSIFLYNSELWSLTKTQEKQIDAFHRKQLRYALNIHYPKTISNQKLYQITKTEPWSISIKRRRLNFAGHLMRLDENTPAKQALYEAIKPTKRKPGRPKQSWIQTIRRDLDSQLNTTKESDQTFIEVLHAAAVDRPGWRNTVKAVVDQEARERRLN